MIALSYITPDKSLSLRERGLKFFGVHEEATSKASLSLRERGLKCKISVAQTRYGGVALLARAWIEIFAVPQMTATNAVALLARAWIEIYS